MNKGCRDADICDLSIPVPHAVLNEFGKLRLQLRVHKRQRDLSREIVDAGKPPRRHLPQEQRRLQRHLGPRHGVDELILGGKPIELKITWKCTKYTKDYS